jgi:mono/diheme cytochrome c family protein
MTDQRTPSDARYLVGALIIIFAIAFALTACLPQTQLFQSTPTATLTALSRGEQLYNANCLQCHGGRDGGQMMDYPPRHNANGHTWHHPDCQLTDIILNGGGEMGEMMRQMMNVLDSVPRMPAWKDKLSREDIDAILAFIKTWWTEDERQSQARITQETCKGQ